MTSRLDGAALMLKLMTTIMMMMMMADEVVVVVVHVAHISSGVCHETMEGCLPCPMPQDGLLYTLT